MKIRKINLINSFVFFAAISLLFFLYLNYKTVSATVPMTINDECNTLVSAPTGDAYGIGVTNTNVGFGSDGRYYVTKSPVLPPDSANWWNGYSYAEYNVSGQNSACIYVDYAPEGYSLIDDILCYEFKSSGGNFLNINAQIVEYSSNWIRVKYLFLLSEDAVSVRFILTSYNNTSGTIATWMQQISKVTLEYTYNLPAPNLLRDECNNSLSWTVKDSYGISTANSNVGFGNDDRYQITTFPSVAPDATNWWNGYSYIEYKLSGQNVATVTVDCAPEAISSLDDIFCYEFLSVGGNVVKANNKTVKYSANWVRVRYTFVLSENADKVRFVFTSYNNDTIETWMQQISEVELKYNEIPPKPQTVTDECNGLISWPIGECYGVSATASDVGFGNDGRFCMTTSPSSAPDSNNWWNGYSYIQYDLNGQNFASIFVDYPSDKAGVFNDIFCYEFAENNNRVISVNNKVIRTSANWTRIEYSFVLSEQATEVRFIFTAYNNVGVFETWMQQITKVQLEYLDNIPTSDFETPDYYIDNCNGNQIDGQRADVYNIEVLSDLAATVGDTARTVHGTLSTESYIDYYICNQDTIRVYVYEDILSGNLRPSGISNIKFSLYGTNWEVDATETQVELGRYSTPKRWTKNIVTYKLPSPVESGRIRIHIYNPSGTARISYQIGRVEIFNSEVIERTENISNGNDFSISAWISQTEIGYGLINDSVDFENGIKRMKDCGLNVIMPNIWLGDTLEYRLRLLDTAQKYNMKCYVYDAEFIAYLQNTNYIQSLVEIMVSSYISHEAFIGHFIVDEPSDSVINSLQTASARYKVLLPDKRFFVNLLPDYGYSNYINYINNYFNKLDLDYISFDYYALEGQYGSYSLKSTYLKNLDILAKKVQENNADFYAIIATTGHYNSSDSVYIRRPSSEKDLSFQAFAALAYGVKGITWFTYEAMSDSTFGEQYGMIDKFGNKTEIYGYAETVNNWIKSFNQSYLNYEWTGTMVNEGTNGGANSSFTALGSNVLTTHANISGISSTEDVIMGTFDNNGQKAFMLVNYNDPCLNLTSDVTLTFDKQYKLTIHNKGNTETVILSPDKQYKISLECGNGAFIELNDICL